MESFSSEHKKRTKWIIGIAAACILLFLGLQNIGAVAHAFSYAAALFTPLILGLAIAMILNVPMHFLEQHLWPNSTRPLLLKLRKPLAFLISLIAILGALVGIIWLVIPELIEAITILAESVIRLVDRLSGMENAEIAELPFGNFLLDIDWDRLLESAQSWLKNQSGTIVNTAFNTLSSLMNGLYSFFIALVFSVYILFSKKKLKTQACRLLRAWLPKKYGEWSIHALSVANANFRSYISGRFFDAVILGLLCLAGMLLLQIPYAPMISALVGVTALIPVIGGMIGALVGSFMILSISPIKALIFLIFIVVLLQIEGNLIYPKLLDDKLNLPAIWILASVTVGGGLAGPIGMLISVPIAATAYVLIKEATVNREQKS